MAIVQRCMIIEIFTAESMGYPAPLPGLRVARLDFQLLHYNPRSLAIILDPTILVNSASELCYYSSFTSGVESNGA